MKRSYYVSSMTITGFLSLKQTVVELEEHEYANEKTFQMKLAKQLVSDFVHDEDIKVLAWSLREELPEDKVYDPQVPISIEGLEKEVEYDQRKSLPDGMYKALMAGYVAVVKLAQEAVYPFKFGVGYRGINIPCFVVIKDGIAYLDIE